MLALAVDTLVLVACLAWAGGLFTVGAVTAPTVFRSGIPQAGDLMATVFQRFDRVAVGLAVLVLVLEGAALITHRETSGRLRAARLVAALGMALSVGLQAAYFTPTIARLHQSGVHPGDAAFDRVHRASSLGGRAGVIAALALAVAVVHGRRGRDGDEGGPSA